jgi:hypothetical protein
MLPLISIKPNTTMKTIYQITLLIAIATLGSCQKEKVNKELAGNFRKEYESLSIVHKSIEKEQSKFVSEKDTLVGRLREVKGALSPEVESFNEKYRNLLDNQDEIVTQHYNILGEIAQLEDEVLKNEISSEEAMKESKSINESQKSVLNLYQQTLLKRDSLLKEYQALVGDKVSMKR